MTPSWKLESDCGTKKRYAEASFWRTILSIEGLRNKKVLKQKREM